tara:strand:+ start:355 stop:1161 length:807 start_codon:yes stop_codon:yes gene_type:complete
MALKKSQQSLKNWTKQKWRTKSGKKSSETGERYLPEAAIKNMSDEEYAATTRAKREGTRKGKQFVAQPKEIAKKTKKYRSMKNGGMMKGKKSQMGMVKSAAPKRKKEMSDKEYFEMQELKRRKGQKSMSGKDSINFLTSLMRGATKEAATEGVGEMAAKASLNGGKSKKLKTKKISDKEFGSMEMGGVLKGALKGALTGAATGAISGIGAEKVPSAKSGMRFKKLSRKIQKSGKSKSAADAIAAAVGRKKYGAKKFAAMAAAGRKKGK